MNEPLYVIALDPRNEQAAMNAIRGSRYKAVLIPSKYVQYFFESPKLMSAVDDVTDQVFVATTIPRERLTMPHEKATNKELSDLATTILLELIRSSNLCEILSLKRAYSFDDIVELSIDSAKKILQ